VVWMSAQFGLSQAYSLWLSWGSLFGGAVVRLVSKSRLSMNQ
jgi:hypothetical protein